MRESAAGPSRAACQDRGVAPLGRLVIALLTALAAAGCSTTTSGIGVPATPSGSGSVPPAATSDPSTISLPPRPRSLPLTHLDPCTLLTSPQQAGLGVDPGVEGHPDVNWHDPQCGFQLTDPGTLPSYNVQAVTATGIQFWLNPMLADNVRPVSIAGFPAVDVTSKASTANSCQTVVSVADGQMLIVQFDFPPNGTTAAQSCASTERVAAAAVATLQTAN
ncbi:MAG TPA: DUF3558 domain-containing protein [Pseudonocardiaceae bacterium]|nr:DUF3558 domain-containing protein [Pseudonocardiaceae bacterium]